MMLFKLLITSCISEESWGRGRPEKKYFEAIESEMTIIGERG